MSVPLTNPRSEFFQGSLKLSGRGLDLAAIRWRRRTWRPGADCVLVFDTVMLVIHKGVRTAHEPPFRVFPKEPAHALLDFLSRSLQRFINQFFKEPSVKLFDLNKAIIVTYFTFGKVIDNDFRLLCVVQHDMFQILLLHKRFSMVLKSFSIGRRVVSCEKSLELSGCGLDLAAIRGGEEPGVLVQTVFWYLTW